MTENQNRASSSHLFAAILAGAAAALSSPAGAVVVDVFPDVNVSDQTATSTTSETSIDVNPTDPENLVIVSHSDDFATLRTFFSKDRGNTWTAVSLGDGDDDAKLEAAAGETVDSDFRFDPSVAFDGDGNVYVAYGASLPEVMDDPATVGVDESRDPKTAVVVAKSIDGGMTYSQVTVVDLGDDMGGTPANDKWHLATGPSKADPDKQAVYVAWTQNTDRQRIVAAGSTDGGATFSAATVVSDDVAADQGFLFADPAVDSDGNLSVSWLDFREDSGRILVDRSTDGGATFGADKVVSTLNPEFKNDTVAGSRVGFDLPISPQPEREITAGPVLDADTSGLFTDRLYSVFVDLEGEHNFGTDEDTDIFVTFSDDGGTTWSDRVRVNDDTGQNSQFQPWIDVDPVKGIVGVIWYDARNDMDNEAVETFVAFSLDGGASFLPNVRLSDGSFGPTDSDNDYLEYIGLAGFDHHFHGVWAEGFPGSEVVDIVTALARVPEPSTALLLVAALPWMRARRPVLSGAARAPSPGSPG